MTCKRPGQAVPGAIGASSPFDRRAWDRPDPTKGDIMGEEQALSLDDIRPALLGIEQLILALDYAMWLCIAYEGKPDDAPVSLVQGPEQERSGAIDAYLRDHRDELRVKWLQCPTCKKVVLEVSETRCNACRVALEPELASEEELRGRAWERLIWTIPGEQARYIVPTRLVQKLTPGQTVSGEYQLPKKAVLSHLVKFVRLVKDRDIGRCWEHLNIKSPSTLVPQGANLEERHRSYLVTRERLVLGYNWLTGIARQYPEFMDDYEQHKGIRRFPPALTLEEARGETAPAAAGEPQRVDPAGLATELLLMAGAKLEAPREPLEAETALGAEKGVGPRNAKFLEWYEAINSDTYHKPAKIRDRWNGMKPEERAAICLRAQGRVTVDTVVTGIKRARGGKKPAKPKRKAKKRS
ncbi:MAG: hypothetical protein ABIP48_07875 [Planctomycetota bacterium]